MFTVIITLLVVIGVFFSIGATILLLAMFHAVGILRRMERDRP